MMPHFFVKLSTCVPNSTSICVSNYVCPFLCMPKCLPVSVFESVCVFFLLFIVWDPPDAVLIFAKYFYCYYKFLIL